MAGFFQGPSEKGSISCDIRQHVAVLSTNNRNGWTTEANIISWNNGPEKLDIRSWSPDHEKRSKGITLRADEARVLGAALVELFRNQEGQA